MSQRRLVVSLIFLVFFALFSCISSNQPPCDEKEGFAPHTCFYVMHCEEHDNMEDQVKKCHDTITEEDMTDMYLKWMEEYDSKYKYDETDYIVLIDKMCPPENERDELEDLSKNIMERYAKTMQDTCKEDSQCDRCKRFEKTSNLFGETFKMLQDEGKC